MTQKHFTVLYIEDNQPDVELLIAALNTVPDILFDVINIQNGKKAIDFLYKKNDFKNAETPNFIILDINLPKINGLDILRKIKSDNYLKSIPVVIYSTSELEKDIEESYYLNANTYITKTFDLQELFRKINTLAEYWFKTVELPIPKNTKK